MSHEIRTPQFNYRILLVEDNEINQQVAKMMLEGFGATVEVANNGRKALEKWQSDPYALIFMDCQMPEMDGFEASQEIRIQEPEETRVPIVALTANALKGDRDRCVDAGMDDYVTKPFDHITLSDALMRHLEPTGSIDQSNILKSPDLSETNQNSQVIDLDMLLPLRELMDDGFTDLVCEYLLSTRRLLGEMESAYQTTDSDGLLRSAHSLKSSSANLGAVNLSQIAGDFEEQLRLGTDVDAPDYIKSLHQEFTKVQSALVAGFNQDRVFTH